MTSLAPRAAPSCRFCGARLAHVFADLGVTPLANRNLRPDQVTGERKYPLIARVCDQCFLVQVDDSVPPNDIFSDYPYFSSFSEGWVAHCERYCGGMTERFRIGGDSFVVEVASNDGQLLSHFRTRGVPVLGVEPAALCPEAFDRVRRYLHETGASRPDAIYREMAKSWNQLNALLRSSPI